MEYQDFTEKAFFEIKDDLQNLMNKINSYKLSNGCREEINHKTMTLLSSLIFEIQD